MIYRDITDNYNIDFNIHTVMSVKERIIRTLLISPKSTNEIAMALGNEDKKYNAVDKDLKTLQSGGFIHYKKIKIPGKTGPVAKTYDIVYEIQHLRALLIKYPSLISDMQKNDEIISLLVDKYKSDIRFEILGDLLPLSTSFFRNYLTNDSFFDQFNMAWFNLNVESSKVERSSDYEAVISSSVSFILFEMFKHCVIEDKINGVHIQDAFEFVQKNRDQYSLDRVMGWYRGNNYANDNTESEIENIDIYFSDCMAFFIAANTPGSFNIAVINSVDISLLWASMDIAVLRVIAAPHLKQNSASGPLTASQRGHCWTLGLLLSSSTVMP